LAYKHRKAIAAGIMIADDILNQIDPDSVIAKKSKFASGIVGALSGSGACASRSAKVAPKKKLRPSKKQRELHPEERTPTPTPPPIYMHGLGAGSRSLVIGKDNTGMMYAPAAYEGLNYLISQQGIF